ncbi:hypothetical protein CASFOL_016931 [Castilleja foliolosa]|uniref:Uncharacterized protein n=1 Tax=Castilleja foliolosa TaxID=1961234 RepID=A0ABD3DD19_9LAMI
MLLNQAMKLWSQTPSSSLKGQRGSSSTVIVQMRMLLSWCILIPFILLQVTENVLAESRMMIPDCSKRLEFALSDLKNTVVYYSIAEIRGVTRPIQFHLYCSLSRY